MIKLNDAKSKMQEHRFENQSNDSSLSNYVEHFFISFSELFDFWIWSSNRNLILAKFGEFRAFPVHAKIVILLQSADSAHQISRKFLHCCFLCMLLSACDFLIRPPHFTLLFEFFIDFFVLFFFSLLHWVLSFLEFLIFLFESIALFQSYNLSLVYSLVKCFKNR